jgi:hypothetical protein
VSLRTTIALLGLAAVAPGCGYELTGWWELARWDIERGGESISAEDAGVLSWQDVGGDGDFQLFVSYAYDPAAFAFAPLAEPVGPAAQPADGIGATYGPDDPIFLTSVVDGSGAYQQVQMFMERYDGSRMVMEGTGGDTTLRWVFVR